MFVEWKNLKNESWLKTHKRLFGYFHTWAQIVLCTSRERSQFLPVPCVFSSLSPQQMHPCLEKGFQSPKRAADGIFPKATSALHLLLTVALHCQTLRDAAHFQWNPPCPLGWAGFGTPEGWKDCARDEDQGKSIHLFLHACWSIPAPGADGVAGPHRKGRTSSCTCWNFFIICSQKKNIIKSVIFLQVFSLNN